MLGGTIGANTSGFPHESISKNHRTAVQGSQGKVSNLVKHEYFLFARNSFLTFQSRLRPSIDEDSGVIDNRFSASHISGRKAKALKSDLTYRNAIGGRANMQRRFFALLLWSIAAVSLPARSSAATVDNAVETQSTAGAGAETHWTGAYVGGHVGYAGGSSDWSARDNGGAGPVLSGSLDFFKGFSFSKGTGSYFAGFQAGYNYLLPSNWVLGVEGDVSFPNTLQATRQFSSAAGVRKLR